MTDKLESVRRYLPSFQPFVTEDDVVVKELPLMRFIIPNTDCVDSNWNDQDFRFAESYYQRLIDGEIPPAIVVNGSNVLDGHHRLWAYRKWRREGNGTATIPAIDLKDLFEIVDRHYS